MEPAARRWSVGAGVYLSRVLPLYPGVVRGLLSGEWSPGLEENEMAGSPPILGKRSCVAQDSVTVVSWFCGASGETLLLYGRWRWRMGSVSVSVLGPDIYGHFGRMDISF
eukprot:sb/3477311/